MLLGSAVQAAQLFPILKKEPGRVSVFTAAKSSSR